MLLTSYLSCHGVRHFHNWLGRHKSSNYYHLGLGIHQATCHYDITWFEVTCNHSTFIGSISYPGTWQTCLCLIVDKILSYIKKNHIENILEIILEYTLYMVVIIILNNYTCYMGKYTDLGDLKWSSNCNQCLVRNTTVCFTGLWTSACNIFNNQQLPIPGWCVLHQLPRFESPGIYDVTATS